MAEIRSLVMTFVDGFSPLDNVWGGGVRPGSTENLIDEQIDELPQEASEVIDDLHRRAAANLRQALLEKAASLEAEEQVVNPGEIDQGFIDRLLPLILTAGNEDVAAITRHLFGEIDFGEIDQIESAPLTCAEVQERLLLGYWGPNGGPAAEEHLKTCEKRSGLLRWRGKKAKG